MESPRIVEMLAAGDGVTEANAAQDAEQLEAVLKRVRRHVLSTAEDLYRSASGQAERAEMDLAEFDRQSEVVLGKASVAVQMARAALRTSPGGDGLAKLETDLQVARTVELMVLRVRTASRVPLEEAWRTAAIGVCQWGETLLRAAAHPRTVMNGSSLSNRDLAQHLLKVVPAANGPVYPAGRES